MASAPCFAITSSACVVAALASVIAVAVTVSGKMDGYTSTQAPFSGGFYASILTSNGALGYVFVGVLAFVLGACVTILCYRMREDKSPADKRPAGEDAGEKVDAP